MQVLVTAICASNGGDNLAAANQRKRLRIGYGARKLSGDKEVS